MRTRCVGGVGGLRLNEGGGRSLVAVRATWVKTRGVLQMPRERHAAAGGGSAADVVARAVRRSRCVGEDVSWTVGVAVVRRRLVEASVLVDVVVWLDNIHGMRLEPVIWLVALLPLM